MSKKTMKHKDNKLNFAKNVADLSSIDNKNKQAQQNNEVSDDANKNFVDKKLIKSIEKEEKQELKNDKIQEKKLRKERKKRRKLKIKELVRNKKLEEKQLRYTQEQTIKELEKRGGFSSWFRLDNAASIYPSAADKDWNFVFRISANLKNKINPIVLQSAIDDILPRFPSFNVRLRKGFFWNYFERKFSRLKVQREVDFPCKKFDLNDDNSFLIRVLYSDYKIILEVFHGITDGRGALYFFNSLLARYIERCGVNIEN